MSFINKDDKPYIIQTSGCINTAKKEFGECAGRPLLTLENLCYFPNDLLKRLPMNPMSTLRMTFWDVFPTILICYKI